MTPASDLAEAWAAGCEQRSAEGAAMVREFAKHLRDYERRHPAIAHGPEIGFKLLDTPEYDVVIDAVLPQADGDEVLCRLRPKPHRFAVLKLNPQGEKPAGAVATLQAEAERSLPRCRNCEHWLAGSYMRCTLITGGLSREQRRKALAWVDSETDSELHVEPEFGCVLWQKRREA